jgi:hypothetical protein
MATFKTVHKLQLLQLRTLDPKAHQHAITMLGNGFAADAVQIIVTAMQAALTRLTAQPEAGFDLLIASRNYGRDPNDAHARITWLKRAGQPKETPTRRVTLLDLLPSLAGYNLVATEKTATEVVRKYRREAR